MSFRHFGLVSVLAIACIGATDVRAQPAKVDLGPDFQKRGFTARVQGDRDTCSLFAITGAAEFECFRKETGPHPRLSEEFLIWAANEATGQTGDQAMFYEATHGLNALGICAEELMPYASNSDKGRKPSAKAIADAKGRSHRWKVEWIRRWNVKRPVSNQEMEAIKKALAHGHPVACGMRWPKSLVGSDLINVPPPSGVFDGHSILLTGYEDDPKTKGKGIFHFRNSDGPGWGKEGYGTMSFAYLHAYANDAVWLQFGPPGSEVPIQRFEAESMTVVAADRCETSRQKMEDWGGRMWSRGEQLFCRAADGGSVGLAFEVHKNGRYRVRALATSAPDFGTIRIWLDGKPEAASFDLYAGRICPSGSLELGNHTLNAGKHILRVAVAGKDAVSANYFFGLDALDLLPVE